MKKFAFVLLIVLVSVFVFMSMSSKPENTPISEKVAATVVHQSEASEKGLFSQTSADRGDIKSLDTKAPNESLAGSLREAQSYRQFILAAVQQPERGGIAYAQSAGTTCAIIQTSLTTARTNKPGAPSTAISLAAALLKSRCDIARAELVALEKSQAYVEASKKDPLLALRSALDRAEPQEKTLLVSKALESADPIVLGPHMLAWRKGAGGSNRSEGYFNGKWHTDEEADINGVRDAFNLAKCDLGWDCGQSNPMTLAECAIAGVCHDSLEKTLMALKMPEQDWAKTQVLRKQIVEAVRTKNVGFFVPSK